jgi:hypothetical protein
MSEEEEDINEQQNTSLIKEGGENNGINTSFVVAMEEEEKGQGNKLMGKIVTYKSTIKKILQMISLGKYRTPLYFKESESYSSMFGGLFSLIFMLFMFIVGISIFYSIFTKDRYELSQSTQKFYTYKFSKDSSDP